MILESPPAQPKLGKAGCAQSEVVVWAVTDTLVNSAGRHERAVDGEADSRLVCVIALGQVH